MRSIARYLPSLAAIVVSLAALWSTETPPESPLTPSELSAVQNTGETVGAAWGDSKALWKAAQ